MTEITGKLTIPSRVTRKIKSSLKHILDWKEHISKAIKKDTTFLVEIILGGTILLDASDLHFEPKEKDVLLRVRIDGVLHNVMSIKNNLYERILNRIKLLSGIKLNITDKAQDGRFTFFFENMPVETRVSTLPCEYGESLVLRILNPKSLIEIEQLGVRKEMLEIFKKQIRQPNGMIIVTGPTGCGKTTTLYAILKYLQKEEIKIITIEDPIEYHLEGISQTQVNPKKGYDFATGLQAIVRQDPDVILVGEIRDPETAKIAIQAALTGHLVLTTLHTNDAAGTVARLQALGEKPLNIASAINISIAQRLVRKVCKKCSKIQKPTKKELEIIKNILKETPSSIKKKIKIPSLSNIRVPRAEGCPYCNFTGYKGRTGIFEFFLVDSEMESFILKSPSIPELFNKAREKGMITMKEDGLLKVFEGITTLEELIRVTGE